jgi:hypothetical protein
MVKKLADAMAYLCDKYPYKDELSKARLTKMVYLTDWRMAIQHDRQLTSLEWTFNHYGPYLDDVREEALRNPMFEIKADVNMYGSPKDIINIRSGAGVVYSLTAEERSALDHVISKTKELTWGPFIKLVYGTYPIATQARYQKLDLVALAATYRRQLQEIHSELPARAPMVIRDNGDMTLAVGDRVRHDKQGVGSVVRIDGHAPATVATIEFDSGIRKRLVIKISPLEKL